MDHNLSLKPAFGKVLVSIVMFAIVFFLKYVSQISTELSRPQVNAIIYDSLLWAVIFSIISYLACSMICPSKDGTESKKTLPTMAAYLAIIIIMLVILKLLLIG